MINRLFLFFLISSVNLVTADAQELGRPFIENFSRKQYGSSLSNWQVVQDSRGVIYSANLQGILCYDGNFWQLTQFENKSSTFSVHEDVMQRVFIGGKEAYGYINVDEFGRNVLTTMNDDNYGNNLGPIFSITSNFDSTYFKSSTAIIRLVGEQSASWKTNSTDFQPIISSDGDIFSALDKNGIVKIVGDSLISIVPDLDNTGLRFVSSLPNNEILIGTFLAGIYKASYPDIFKTFGNVNGLLKKNLLLTGVDDFRNKAFHLGTFKGGIVSTDGNFNLLRLTSKDHGLKSNIINGLTLDSHNNLWAATQEGVSHVEINSPFTYWDESCGLSGIPWSVIRYSGKIYVGTTNGLYMLNKNKLEKVSGIDSRVWSLEEVVGQYNETSRLFIGTDEGVFELKNNTLKKIKSLSFTYKLYYSKSKNSLIIGHRSGISILNLSFKNYQLETLKELENATILQIKEDVKGNIWVSIKFKGVYKISLDRKKEVVFFGEKNGLPDTNHINIIEVKDNIYMTTRSGIYSVSEAGQVERDSVILKCKEDINLIVKDSQSNYYAVLTSFDNSQRFVKLNENGRNSYELYDTPFRRLPEMEFEVIYPEEDGTVWIGGSEGLFRYDPKIKKDYTLPFNTLVRRAITSDSVIFYGNYSEPVEGSEIPRIVLDQPKSFIPKLSFENNNITFQYSATSYEASERNEFSHYLQNNEKTWSAWSTETKKEYNNLQPGRYVFHVKSKNIYDTIGRTASYEFVILPPWYMTTWAYSMFTILIALSVWLIAMAYSYRVRLHRKRLKLLVADRTYEVISQKREIEQQRDELKNKNEEITTQRDSIQEKNKLLERSKSEIMTMNESLKGLNSSLEKEVEKRTSRIKSTLKKLQQTNTELDTFIYRASHDLKGPISRISGLTSLAKLEAPDDAYEKYFSLIELTTLEMQSLLAKLTQVHEVLNKRVVRENVDIPSLLHEVRESVKYLNDGEKTTYSFDLDEDITVRSDKYLLRIVLQNIMENALIFRKSDRYNHHIHIETRKQEKSFIIKVRDTGIGIEEDQYKEIYSMFYRGSDKSKGNGLGLYLVKSSIEKLRGKIKIDSEVSLYTEFSISIPLG